MPRMTCMAGTLDDALEAAADVDDFFTRPEREDMYLDVGAQIRRPDAAFAAEHRDLMAGTRERVGQAPAGGLHAAVGHGDGDVNERDSGHAAIAPGMYRE